MHLWRRRIAAAETIGRVVERVYNENEIMDGRAFLVGHRVRS